MKKPEQHVMRTRFAKEIVAEFILPSRKSNKVLILLSGAPTYPGKRADLLPAFSAMGYWTFLPRYRGTWESDGLFLKKSPHLDVIDVMNGITKGFVGIETGKKYKIAEPEFYIIGGSFGGPAAILASRDKRVRKVVALAPVIDWTKQQDTAERLSYMAHFVPNAFANVYRYKEKVWSKLAKGKFYSPHYETKTVDGSKLFIVHAKDDNVVHYQPSRIFASATGANLLLVPTGGHLGLKYALTPKIWKRINTFFNAR